jgi:quinol monooxygenase YgiN
LAVAGDYNIFRPWVHLSVPNLSRRGWLFVERLADGPAATFNFAKGVALMFVRTVDCHVKPGKQDELSHKLRHEVLPILQKQAGFVDVIGLVSENDPEMLRSLTFWKSKEDAERYHRENYTRILESVRPLLKREPSIEVFTVDTSTTHRIVAGKAA